MTIYKKLAEFQKEFKGVEKKKDNPFTKSKYADLDEVINKIKQTFESVGLVFTQPLLIQDGKQFLSTIIIDVDSDTKMESMLDISLMTDKVGAHGMGSAITYARRYALCSLLGIVGEPDDDGNEPDDTVHLRRVIASQDKVKEHFDSISEIKTALANEDRAKAMEFWTEIPQEDQHTLWIAPTKGGIWTVEEYKLMKGV